MCSSDLLAPAGHAAVDQLRIAPEHDIGAEAEALHHAGTEAFDQRVGMAELAGTRCSDPVIALDTSGLALPAGSAGTTSARVSCTVRLSDLLVPGMPGALHVESTARSTLDSHRERYS